MYGCSHNITHTLRPTSAHRPHACTHPLPMPLSRSALRRWDKLAALRETFLAPLRIEVVPTPWPRVACTPVRTPLPGITRGSMPRIQTSWRSTTGTGGRCETTGGRSTASTATSISSGSRDGFRDVASVHGSTKHACNCTATVRLSTNGDVTACAGVLGWAGTVAVDPTGPGRGRRRQEGVRARIPRPYPRLLLGGILTHL